MLFIFIFYFIFNLVFYERLINGSGFGMLTYINASRGNHYATGNVWRNRKGKLMTELYTYAVKF